jgi:hypothetical protein
MTIDWGNIISEALASLVPIAITVVGLFVIKYLKNKGATEEQVALFEKAYKLVATAVKSMNQTVVDALKAEGDFTKEKQAAVKSECLVTVNKLLTDAMKLALEESYGSLETLLDIMLEAAVGAAKKEMAIVVAA